MIKGIGVDIVKIERFFKVKSKRFMERCFTGPEQKYLENKGVQTMAGLFAAKEAVAKALGTGFNGFWPCDIEIRHDEMGKPTIALHNKAAALGRGHAVFVSISHNETDAIAFAVIHKR